MLNTEQLTSLFQILYTQDQSFETIVDLLRKNFSKSEYHQLALSLKILIDDKYIHTITELFIAYFILFILYKEGTQQARQDSNDPTIVFPNTLSQLVQKIFDTEVECHKFHVEFAKKIPKTEEDWELYEKMKGENAIRLFLIQLLSGRTEFLPKTPRECSKILMEMKFEPIAKEILVNLDILKQSTIDRENENTLNGFRMLGISPVIQLKDYKNIKFLEPKSDLNAVRFEPKCSRPAPPLMEIEKDEIFWIQPNVSKAEIIWDYSMFVEEQNSEVKELFAKSFKQQLLPTQQQQILNALESNLSLIYKCGLTPNKLPDLVENNPDIAIQVLLKLINTSSPFATEYLSVLVNIPVSLSSMEVVNRLTSATQVPKEFLNIYILNCINYCEMITDKSMQIRLVRLTCVFLQSLIRNQIINVQDVMIDVKTFCIHFIKVKEAIDLFQLLEQESKNKL